jgi:hypothetical protein
MPKSQSDEILDSKQWTTLTMQIFLLSYFGEDC